MLMSVVVKVLEEIGADYPVYADDTNLYICGASREVVDKVSVDTLNMARDMGYGVVAFPGDKIHKLGRMANRMI